MPGANGMSVVPPSPVARTTHTPDGAYEFELSPTGMLGSGAHGVVRVARDVKTGEAVAIKVMAASMLGAIAKELIAQGKMSHPHVVRLLGTQVDLDKRRVYMIMELCPGGELFDRIAECGRLDEDSARRYLLQMAQAIQHCHALNVYHRDLKPENILLDSDNNVKIADFGLASIVRGQDGHVSDDATYLQHTKCGSLMYAAPEVLTSTQQAGYSAAKADIWSLGIILYSMLSGALPFQVAAASKCPRYARVMVLGMAPLCKANGFSAAASELLCRMLEPNPEKRASINEVVACAWLKPLLGSMLPPPTPLSKWASLVEETVPPGGKRKREGDEAAGGSPAKQRATGGEEGAPAVEQARPVENPKERVAAAPDVFVGASGVRKNVATGAGPSSESSEVAPGIELDEDEKNLGGINGLLVRSLGWVQLPSEKENMVADVAGALDTLGVKYSIVRGELSDVVWVGDNPPPQEASADPAAAAAPSPVSTEPPAGDAGQEFTPTGQLTVRIRIHQNHNGANETSDIHIDRHAGDVLQFHSFYRDVRKQLAGANGWRAGLGRYWRDVNGDIVPGDPPAAGATQGADGA